jgi:hypothetical protein
MEIRFIQFLLHFFLTLSDHAVFEILEYRGEGCGLTEAIKLSKKLYMSRLIIINL